MQKQAAESVVRVGRKENKCVWQYYWDSMEALQQSK